MRTNRATAPESLTILLKEPLTTFTVSDVVETLDITYKQARAVIDHGVSEDLLRVISSPQQSQACATYENPSWRKRWLTKKWIS